MFWHWLWAIPGAFLSVPLLAVFKIVCDHVAVLTPIGHILGGALRQGSKQVDHRHHRDRFGAYWLSHFDMAIRGMNSKPRRS